MFPNNFKPKKPQDDEQDDYERQEKGSYHMAFNYLSRLDGLFTACMEFSFGQEYDSWYKALASISQELHPFFTSDEVKDHQETYKTLRTKIEDYKRKRNSWWQCFANIDPEKRIPFRQWPELHDELRDWEIKLREVAKRSGLLMPMKGSGLDAARK